MNNYLVATIKPWNLAEFERVTPTLPGNWHLIDSPEQLTLEAVAAINPKYMFFPHWSWLVPEEILTRFACVCFHMTDLPYGRGGSPLQNLIVRGHKNTMMSALQMEATLDTGPIYLKAPLSLAGSAQEIFKRSAQLTFEMISTIVKLEPEPQPQVGTVVEFQRRTPAESELPKEAKISTWYDHIRMLDAESYPKAFINYGQFQLEFEQATPIEDNGLNAKVTIRKRDDNSHE